MFKQWKLYSVKLVSMHYQSLDLDHVDRIFQFRAKDYD